MLASQPIQRWCARGVRAWCSTWASLPKPVAASLQRQGITSASEVQQSCFLPIFSGNDCVILSETGAGKTLAYLLPILQREITAYTSDTSSSADSAHLCVLVPTVELVHQVSAVLKGLLPANLASLVYPAYQNKGPPRRGPIFAIVATPTALIEVCD